MEKKSPEIEEYLETLVRYKEQGKKAKVKHLAKDLKISSASVSGMLKKLTTKGFVKSERYGDIILTSKGEKLGRSVLRKHRLLEKFLMLLGVSSKKVHDEACVLEHAISDDVEKALRKAIWDPGNVEINADDLKRLCTLKSNDIGTVVFVVGGKQVSRRLTDMGLTPGTRIKVLRASRTAGPVEVQVRSSSLAIGRGLAEKVFVKVR